MLVDPRILSQEEHREEKFKIEPGGQMHVVVLQAQERMVGFQTQSILQAQAVELFLTPLEP